MKYQKLNGGVVKRTEKRILGLFIDGTGLDRATRRLNRKVDLTRLVRGVTSGIKPIIARYYTLIPYEDDSRQRAFLDAVQRAGLTVIVKRLPPKGISRQVSVDIEMAADITAFAMGRNQFRDLSEYRPEDFSEPGSSLPSPIPTMGIPRSNNGVLNHPQIETHLDRVEKETAPITFGENDKVQRIINVVCPSRDLAYPISLAKELGVDTATADFGQFTGGDILKSAAKWIDLSDSETIWRE